MYLACVITARVAAKTRIFRAISQYRGICTSTKQQSEPATSCLHLKALRAFSGPQANVERGLVFHEHLKRVSHLRYFDDRVFIGGQFCQSPTHPQARGDP